MPSRCACSLGLVAVGLFAATVPPSAAPAAARSIRFERLSLDDGLSQAAVNTMLQDQTGFLWLGTQDGLNRFDGLGFEVFGHDRSDPDSLSNGWIEDLVEDEAGNLWIATRGGGLNRWVRSRGAFEAYRHDPDDPQSLANDEVRCLLLDRDGFLWIGTESSGLDRLDPATGSWLHFRHDPADATTLGHDAVRSLIQDSTGDLWVGTLGGGLSLLRAGETAFRRLRHDPADPASLPDDNVRAFAEDAGGDFWVATHGGLARLDRAAMIFERFAHEPGNPSSLSGNRVRALLEDSVGRLWVGTDSGLNLRRPDGTFARYRYDPADLESLGNDRVASLLEDRGGVLWVGTQGAGLAKWDPRKWRFSNDPIRPGDLGNSDVLSLTLDRDGRLWIGTAGGGIDVLDRATGEITRYRHDSTDPTSLSANLVTALATDLSGTVWAGTIEGGLNRFDADRGTFVHFRHDPARPDSLGSDGVMTIYPDPFGSLWLGTFGGGVNRLNPRGGFDRWQHDPADPESLSNDRVTAFASNPDGTLWVGTFGGGLNWFSPASGRFVRLRHDPERDLSLSHDGVMMVLRAPDGVVWVGTQGGLNRLLRFDEATGEAEFRRYGVGDGLPGEFVFGVLPDAAGNLWISTNSGLSRFDPWAETFRNYDTSHGLQSEEFNMMAYLRSSDGELFFGGILGFNSFYPQRITTNTRVPPVVLTSFSKLNRPVRLDRPVSDLEEVVLDHRDSVVSFEFAALDFTAPKKNRYRYKLEGFNEEWVDHEHRRHVTFTNLDPGSYVLRVQGSNNDEVWNEDGIALRIVIPPPYWQTLWFRALVLLLTAGLAVLVFGLRTRSMRRRSAELEGMVAERTAELEEAQEQLVRRERLAVLGELAGSVAHELRNPLGVLRNSAYFLKLTGTGGDKAARHLEMIEREIERSNGIITELLDFGRDPQPDRRRFALQRVVRRAVEQVRMPETVAVESDLPAKPMVVDADPDQIERVLVNLIRNAVQAMPEGGELRVSCRERAGEAVIAVADTGVGISAEALPKIFEPLYTGKAKGIGLGLPVSQRYADLNGGRIECESREGEGATFRLILPRAAEEGGSVSGGDAPEAAAG